MTRLAELQRASRRMRESLPQTLSLRGEFASLEPLQSAHIGELQAAASDGDLWNLHYTSVPTHDHCASYVAKALEQRDAGLQLPFVVRRNADQRIVGCTRYYAISCDNRNLSIGYTWYAKSAQRTAINSECKLLLLSHAFETAGCISVQWHTHHENLPSQAAIERLGAVKEGVLRNHLIGDDGAVRHTHCYGMLDQEWPAAKTKLLQRMDSHN